MKKYRIVIDGNNEFIAQEKTWLRWRDLGDQGPYGVVAERFEAMKDALYYVNECRQYYERECRAEDRERLAKIRKVLK